MACICDAVGSENQRMNPIIDAARELPIEPSRPGTIKGTYHPRAPAHYIDASPVSRFGDHYTGHTNIAGVPYS